MSSGCESRTETKVSNTEMVVTVPDYGRPTTWRNGALMQDNINSANAPTGNHAPESVAMADSGGIGVASLASPAAPTNADTGIQLDWLHSNYPSLGAAVAEGAMTLEDALAEADRRLAKPRSGYARKKIELKRAWHKAELLQAKYDALQADFDALRAMYVEMEDALFENAELLERLQSQRPAPQPQYRPEPTVGLHPLFARGR
jgi:hypothetical protein